MTTFIPVDYFSHGTFSPLQKAIINRTDHGYINYKSFSGPEVTAPLQSISEAVESAFILVEKATLPKAMSSVRSTNARSFAFTGDGTFAGLSANPSVTAEQARKTASKWLAVAQFLDAEEKIEAKKKADAEAEAKNARAARLGELALEYFDSYYMDLSSKKVRVIEEIYRLEQEVKERTPYDERDAA